VSVACKIGRAEDPLDPEDGTLANPRLYAEPTPRKQNDLTNERETEPSTLAALLASNLGLNVAVVRERRMGGEVSRALGDVKRRASKRARG
jgi:hypothetical protein